MKKSPPVPTGEQHKGVPNNKLSTDTKTLSFFDTITKYGRISEVDFFSLFDNRRLAIECARHLTSGKYRVLTYRVEE